MISVLIFSLFLFFMLLLILPIKIQAYYDKKKLIFYIYFLFFRFDISSLKHKATKDKGNIKKQSDIKIKEYFNFLFSIFTKKITAFTMIKIFLKRLKFKKLHAVLFVSSSEAEMCAKDYFYIRSAIYYASKVLKLKNKINKFRIQIIPLFFDKSTEIKFELIIETSLSMILLSIFDFTYNYLKNKAKY